MNPLFLLSILLVDFLVVNCVMIKKECPLDEIYKSCAFHEEYSCWTDHSKEKRVNEPTKRLVHCRSGCFCKKGWVRSYPKGSCIVASQCRNQNLEKVLKKLPSGFNVY